MTKPHARKTIAVLLRDLARDRRGAALSLVALTAPMAVGAVGAGVEVGSWYMMRRQAQTAADAAALSGAIELAKGGLRAAIEASAVTDARRNGHGGTPNTDVAVTLHPAGVFGATPTVEVTVTRREPTLFASLFRDGPMTIQARAVAAVETNSTACVLALDGVASAAIGSSGTVDLSLDNCIIASNSNSASAIRVTGNAAIKADSLWTVGGISTGSNTDLDLDRPPVTGGWALDDPYAGLPAPNPGACLANNPRLQGTQTISPATHGVICGSLTINAGATVTMAPGTYYIVGGDLQVNGGASLVGQRSPSGDGVTIVLTSRSGGSAVGNVDINGNADVDIAAPTRSGSLYPYPGVAILQDRIATTNGTSRFNGGSDLRITGAVYMPRREVRWAGGNVTTAPGCTQVVARIVTFTGNAQLDDRNCAAAGVRTISPRVARLVS